MADDKISIEIDTDTAGATAALEELAALAEKAGAAIDAAVDVKRIRFQPGDTVVVRVAHHLPADALHIVARNVREALGSDIKVLVLDAGMTIDVLSQVAA